MNPSALQLAENARQVLGLPDDAQVSVVPASALQAAHCPPFPVDRPAWVVGLDSPEVARAVSDSLRGIYSPGQAVTLVSPSGKVTVTRLEDAPGWPLAAGMVLYLPALAEGSSMEAFQEIIAHLRAPDGCPWDRKQTQQSLRPYLLEETYEALAALDANDPEKMREEFGDILLQVVLHAQVAQDEEQFNLADVLRGVYRKIVYRHPHVFGDVQVDGVGNVLSNWEKLKAEERAANGEAEKGMLDSVPAAMPALVLAQQYQSRAARVGFDWSELEPMLAKVQEELGEVRDAPDAEQRAKELGDLLFAVVNVVRWYKVDAESALRETSQRFKRRFQHIERRARETGRSLPEMTLAEMDVFWEEAKENE